MPNTLIYQPRRSTLALIVGAILLTSACQKSQSASSSHDTTANNSSRANSLAADTKDDSTADKTPQRVVPIIPPRHIDAPTYEVQLHSQQQADGIVIDGKLDEAVWKKVHSFELQKSNQSQSLDTTIQAFWTNTHLYLGAVMEDAHIWSTLKQHDDALWTQEAIKVVLAPTGENGGLIELQINPLTTIFDAHYPEQLSNDADSRVEQIKAATKWRLDNLASAVFVDGELNNSSHQDTAWSFELKIPLSELPVLDSPVAVGQQWFVNVFRADRPSTNKLNTYSWAPTSGLDHYQVNTYGRFNFGAPRQQLMRPKLSPEALQNIRKSLRNKSVNP